MLITVRGNTFQPLLNNVTPKIFTEQVAIVDLSEITTWLPFLGWSVLFCKHYVVTVKTYILLFTGSWGDRKQQIN